MRPGRRRRAGDRLRRCFPFSRRGPIEAPPASGAGGRRGRCFPFSRRGSIEAGLRPRCGGPRRHCFPFSRRGSIEVSPQPRASRRRSTCFPFSRRGSIEAPPWTHPRPRPATFTTILPTSLPPLRLCPFRHSGCRRSTPRRAVWGAIFRAVSGRRGPRPGREISGGCAACDRATGERVQDWPSPARTPTTLQIRSGQAT